MSKPTNEYELDEGRGIMSTIWGWITYPFSWWSSEEQVEPSTEKLVASTTVNPNEVTEIGSNNVTIWCNDQTCTTMKCNKTVCRNVTCSIYDTDVRGECREYTTLPDIPDVQSVTTESSKTTISSSVNDKDVNTATEEHPLELEAVLSSTVNNQSEDNISESIQKAVPVKKP